MVLCQFVWTAAIIGANIAEILASPLKLSIGKRNKVDFIQFRPMLGSVLVGSLPLNLFAALRNTVFPVALQYLLSVLAIINRVIFLIALLAALHTHVTLGVAPALAVTGIVSLNAQRAEVKLNTGSLRLSSGFPALGSGIISPGLLGLLHLGSTAHQGTLDTNLVLFVALAQPRTLEVVAPLAEKSQKILSVI